MKTTPALVEEYDQETVDSFIEVFDLMDVEHLQDAYHGYYRSGAEFAEQFVSDCYGLPDMPYGSPLIGGNMGEPLI